jgi:hypothetical protein
VSPNAAKKTHKKHQKATKKRKKVSRNLAESGQAADPVESQQ